MLGAVFPSARFPGSPGTARLCLRDCYFTGSGTWAPGEHCSETTRVVKGHKIPFHGFILSSEAPPRSSSPEEALAPALELAQTTLLQRAASPTHPGTSSEAREGGTNHHSHQSPSGFTRQKHKKPNTACSERRNTTLLQPHPPPHPIPREGSGNVLPFLGDDPHVGASHPSLAAKAAAFQSTHQAGPTAAAWHQHHSPCWRGRGAPPPSSSFISWVNPHSWGPLAVSVNRFAWPLPAAHPAPGPPQRPRVWAGASMNKL